MLGVDLKAFSYLKMFVNKAYQFVFIKKTCVELQKDTRIIFLPIYFNYTLIIPTLGPLLY